MLDRLTELAQWWRDLPPDMAFLFALPFAVAAVALAADLLRHRARRRTHVNPQ